MQLNKAEPVIMHLNHRLATMQSDNVMLVAVGNSSRSIIFTILQSHNSANTGTLLLHSRSLRSSLGCSATVEDPHLAQARTPGAASGEQRLVRVTAWDAGATCHLGLRINFGVLVVERAPLEQLLEQLPAADDVADPDGDGRFTNVPELVCCRHGASEIESPERQVRFF